jgi:hypothetical protein
MKKLKKIYLKKIMIYGTNLIQIKMKINKNPTKKPIIKSNQLNKAI